MSYPFDVYAIDYLLLKVHNTNVNSARDIQHQKQQKVPISTFWIHLVTLTFHRGCPMAHQCEDHYKGYLLVKFHYSDVNSIRDVKTSKMLIFLNFKMTLWPWPSSNINVWHIILKVSSQPTFRQGFITLLWIVLEILIHVFVMDGRMGVPLTAE